MERLRGPSLPLRGSWRGFLTPRVLLVVRCTFEAPEVGIHGALATCLIVVSPYRFADFIRIKTQSVYRIAYRLQVQAIRSWHWVALGYGLPSVASTSPLRLHASV